MTNSPPEPCPKCGGLGFYIDEETNTTVRCDCGRLDTMEYRRRLSNSGIPRKFLNKGFSDFQVPRGDKVLREVRDSARAYATSFEGEHGIILRGSPGSGKTHIAVAIMKEVMRRGFTARYFNTTDLLSEIRETWDRTSDISEADLLRPVEQADLLVLDDLGAEQVADWVRDRFYLIINRRYGCNKPVLITTNCSNAELEARIGERTVSRLCEMCDVSFPRFPDVDFRKAMMR